MLSNYQNHGRADGKRTTTLPNTDWNAHRRLVEISKCISGVLGRRDLPGATDEGRVAIRAILNLRWLIDMQATFDDIQEIANDGWGYRKLLFESSRGRCAIRRSQGHASGSGVRPECLPVVGGGAQLPSQRNQFGGNAGYRARRSIPTPKTSHTFLRMRS